MSPHPFPLAKKHLGQNFLRNKGILDTIVWDDLSWKHILEVWPGPGDLTAALLRKNPASLTVAEIDPDMIPLLEERFSEENLSIFQGDVLNMDILVGDFHAKKWIIHLESRQSLALPTYWVYGNIPYYITSPIIHHFLYDARHLPEKLIFTIQKEVADRIIARDGKHSVLSVACQLVADIEKVCDIHPQNFIPVPKVWSTCLRFTIKNGTDSKKTNQTLNVVKAGFAQKRKKLLSNLSSQYNKEKVRKAFESLGLDENIRAEDLELGVWLNLWKLLFIDK